MLSHYFHLKWTDHKQNICLLYNNCLTDSFISDQNLPFVDTSACSLSFTQKVLWKAIWLLITKNWVSMFLETQNLLSAGNVWNVRWIIWFNHFYQNWFMKVIVNWKNFRRSWGVLGLTSWVCLKAFRVYLAIHNRIHAGAPASARSHWKHCIVKQKKGEGGLLPDLLAFLIQTNHPVIVRLILHLK